MYAHVNIVFTVQRSAPFACWNWKVFINWKVDIHMREECARRGCATEMFWQSNKIAANNSRVETKSWTPLKNFTSF